MAKMKALCKRAGCFHTLTVISRKTKASLDVNPAPSVSVYLNWSFKVSELRASVSTRYENGCCPDIMLGPETLCAYNRTMQRTFSEHSVNIQ